MSNEGPNKPRKEIPHQERLIDPDIHEYLHDYKDRAETYIKFANPQTDDSLKEATIMALELLEPSAIQDGILREPDSAMYERLSKRGKFNLWMSIHLFSEQKGELSAIIQEVERNPNLTREQKDAFLKMIEGLEELLTES
ncbi:MAG: hypothetical protein JWL88_442 [Parcubacteria group bacterium]|nr:hypothetical protein [Parcubacteria group bacterium]